MNRSSVHKCICHKTTFADIKAIAEGQGFDTVEELQAENICSNSCGLCTPYVRLMLKTGETEFEPGAPYKRRTG